jgi:hypothetical protein
VVTWRSASWLAACIHYWNCTQHRARALVSARLGRSQSLKSSLTESQASQEDAVASSDAASVRAWAISSCTAAGGVALFFPAPQPGRRPLARQGEREGERARHVSGSQRQHGDTATMGSQAPAVRHTFVRAPWSEHRGACGTHSLLLQPPPVTTKISDRLADMVLEQRRPSFPSSP